MDINKIKDYYDKGSGTPVSTNHKGIAIKIIYYTISNIAQMIKYDFETGEYKIVDEWIPKKRKT